MKKLIALLLAILMIASLALVSCKNNKGTTGDSGNKGADTEDDGGLVIPEGFGSSNTTGTGTDSAQTSDTEGNQGGNNQVPATSFVDVANQFSVYTYTSTKLRASAMMKANEVVTVNASEELKVIAQNDDWYKVRYGSDEGYVIKDFVTTNKDDTVFTDYATEEDYKTVQIKGDANNINKVNIRQYPIVADEYLVQSVKTLTYAETSNGELLVIGQNATGRWFKVSYQGSVYYLAVNSSTKPLLIVSGEALGGSSQGGI